MSTDQAVLADPVAMGQHGYKPAGNPRNHFLKRAFDIVAASALIVLSAPVMAVIALAIIVQDGRPVLFGHRRIGRNGRAFHCLKFRTMVRDAEAQLQHLIATDPAARAEWRETQKLKCDPRIIPGIGHFLRKTSLDELPQLFNVLRGEMSMVGPRPVVRTELWRYGSHRRAYLSVRPGITGPWQLGTRNDDDYDDRVRKDVSYVNNGSFFGDIRMVLATARVVFNNKGAY